MFARGRFDRKGREEHRAKFAKKSQIRLVLKRASEPVFTLVWGSFAFLQGDTAEQNDRAKLCMSTIGGRRAADQLVDYRAQG